MQDGEKDKVTEDIQPEPEQSKETPKRVSKKPKVVMSPEAIESRYQEHLKRLRGGK